jgi:ABC-type transport system involved in multi-copper enzyme maturation permease subunit
MANDSELILVNERGWRRGLNNLLDNEFGRWWRTRRWWVQALIWTAVIGFMLGAMVTQGGADRETVVMIYGIFASMFPAVAVIITMQSVLIGEKSNGTAAWVLSKPVSRPAFILSKLVANSLTVLVVMVVIPGLVAYLLISIALGGPINPLFFLAGLGVIWLSLLWYLTFTLMLGAFLESRGAVIGISLGLLFIQQYLIGLIPLLKAALPWTLTVPLNNSTDALLPMLLQGQSVASFLPQVLIIGVEIVLFVVLAVWRFNKEEL